MPKVRYHGWSVWKPEPRCDSLWVCNTYKYSARSTSRPQPPNNIKVNARGPFRTTRIEDKSTAATFHITKFLPQRQGQHSATKTWHILVI